MRDIVNSAYNSSTLPAESNLVRMNSAGARSDYRSYRGFLESYGDNKNSIDDQESVSSTDSGISAASKYSETESINPSSRNLNNSKILHTTGSFSNYMENYNNKRFGPVKPATKQNLVKCEIVLQINDPLESSKNEHTEESSEDIIDAARLSKESYKDIKQALVNCFKTQKSNNKENNSKNTPKLTKGEICNTPALSSTCMTISNCDTTNSDPVPPPPPLPILPLNTEQSTCIKPKKWNTVITDYEDSKSSDQGLHEKHPPPNEAASNLAKILKQHLSLPRRKESEQTEQQQCDEKKCKTVLAASPKTERTEHSQPPPFPAQPKLFQPSSPIFRRRSSKENHVQNKIICSPTLSRRVQNGNHTLPRPSQSFARQQQKFPNDSINSSSTMEYNTTTVVPVAEPTTKVTKDNPNVRKLVYNTYRGLLGAYNNKANDMIATLPRNMVREDKGVSKQLESMALQGGLEKLNGRTNPNIEQE